LVLSRGECFKFIGFGKGAILFVALEGGCGNGGERFKFVGLDKGGILFVSLEGGSGHGGGGGCG